MNSQLLLLEQEGEILSLGTEHKVQTPSQNRCSRRQPHLVVTGCVRDRPKLLG